MSKLDPNIWNRSSAFTPEVLASLIAIITKAVQDTTVTFAAELDKLDINVKDRQELIRLLCEGIASGSADIIEKWKDSHRTPVRKAK